MVNSQEIDYEKGLYESFITYNYFFFFTISKYGYALCIETANRLNATAGSIFTASNALYTQNTAGQPVFEVTNTSP